MTKQAQHVPKSEIEKLKLLLEQKGHELEIEAALERVRAKTMAMHKSEELQEVVVELYAQLEPLGLAELGCELVLCDEKNQLLEYWHTNPVQPLQPNTAW